VLVLVSRNLTVKSLTKSSRFGRGLDQAPSGFFFSIVAVLERGLEILHTWPMVLGLQKTQGVNILPISLQQ
jgi:hypothetical protein